MYFTNIYISILDVSMYGVEAALDVLGLLVKPGLLCNDNISSVVTEQSLGPKHWESLLGQ